MLFAFPVSEALCLQVALLDALHVLLLPLLKFLFVLGLVLIQPLVVVEDGILVGLQRLEFEIVLFLYATHALSRSLL